MESDRHFLNCLARFRQLVKEYAQLEKDFSSPIDDWSEDNPPVRLRIEINKLVVPVKVALRDVGLPFTATVLEHGRPVEIDLTTELVCLPTYEGFRGWDEVFDLLERAIGLYEFRIATGTSLHESTNNVDDEEWKLSQILDKALRPSFQAPPRDETHIQEVLKGILLAAGFEFLTSHTMPFGPTTVRPDFYFPSTGIALEVKYVRGRNTGRVVGEMSDDVIRYEGGGARRILFLVYDDGQISDVAEFVRPFAEHDNVRVQVVKH